MIPDGEVWTSARMQAPGTPSHSTHGAGLVVPPPTGTDQGEGGEVERGRSSRLPSLKTVTPRDRWQAEVQNLSWYQPDQYTFNVGLLQGCPLDASSDKGLPTSQTASLFFFITSSTLQGAEETALKAQTSADFWSCAYSSVTLSHFGGPGSPDPTLGEGVGTPLPSLLPSLASLFDQASGCRRAWPEAR